MDSKQPSEQRFALLIDADNVSARYLKPIMDELSKYGTVTYKRIYGDWTLTMHAKWKDALLENSITPIQQFGYTQGKNATDSAMIIDAMDILYTHSVDGFCIVSSDSDFTRLASRIRESGLIVIGMGEKKTPVPFRKACDIFTTLELLLPAQTGAMKAGGRGKGKGEQVASGLSAQSAGPSIEEIERAVTNIVTDNLNNGKATGLGEVGSRLLKRYPDFDVRSYGTNQLKKLLDEFPSILITKDGSSVTVELAEDKEASRDKKPAKGEESFGDKEASKGEEAPKGKESAREVAAEESKGLGEGKDEKDSEGLKNAKDAAGAKGKKRPAKAAKRRASTKLSSKGVLDGAKVEKTVGAAEPVADAAPVVAKKGVVAAAASVVTKEGTDAAAPVASANPQAYVHQLVSEAGSEGVELSSLGKRVRARFRTFKLRDLGYSQFKNYVADLDGIDVESRDGKLHAVVRK